MALNPIIEAFLAAREQASRDFATDQHSILQREQMAEEAKQKEALLKQQLEIHNNTLAQHKAIADATNKIQELEAKAAARRGDSQAMMEYMKGISGGYVQPPTKTTTQQTLNPNFLQQGQPTTFDTTKTEIDPDAVAAALGPLLSGGEAQARASVPLFPPFQNEAAQKIAIEDAQQKAITSRENERFKLQSGLQWDLQNARLDSAETIAAANRENQMNMRKGDWANRLQGYRMKASTKGAGNANKMRDLADTQHIQFMTGQANEASLPRFSSIKDREEFVQALKDAKTTVMSAAQSKSVAGLPVLVNAYQKLKSFADTIKTSSEASRFGSVGAKFDPEIAARESEVNAILEVIARNVQEQKGNLTNEDVTRAKGSTPSLLPGGMWSIGNLEKTLATNKRRTDDFQYHLMTRFNRDTKGFSPEQKQIIFENSGLDQIELSPEVLQRLSKDK